MASDFLVLCSLVFCCVVLLLFLFSSVVLVFLFSSVLLFLLSPVLQHCVVEFCETDTLQTLVVLCSVASLGYSFKSRPVA